MPTAKTRLSQTEADRLEWLASYLTKTKSIILRDALNEYYEKQKRMINDKKSNPRRKLNQ